MQKCLLQNQTKENQPKSLDFPVSYADAATIQEWLFFMGEHLKRLSQWKRGKPIAGYDSVRTCDDMEPHTSATSAARGNVLARSHSSGCVKHLLVLEVWKTATIFILGFTRSDLDHSHEGLHALPPPAVPPPVCLQRALLLLRHTIKSTASNRYKSMLKHSQNLCPNQSGCTSAVTKQ